MGPNERRKRTLALSKSTYRNTDRAIPHQWCHQEKKVNIARGSSKKEGTLSGSRIIAASTSTRGSHAPEPAHPCMHARIKKRRKKNVLGLQLPSQNHPPRPSDAKPQCNHGPHTYLPHTPARLRTPPPITIGTTDIRTQRNHGLYHTRFFPSFQVNSQATPLSNNRIVSRLCDESLLHARCVVRLRNPPPSSPPKLNNN